MSKIKLITCISVFILIGCGFGFYFITNYDIPNIPEEVSSIQETTLINNGVKLEVGGGSGYLSKRGGIWLLSLEGGAFQLGLLHGRLAAPLIRKAELQLKEMFRELVPSFWIRNLLHLFIRWKLKGLDKVIPKEYLYEIAALSHTISKPYIEIDSSYQRVVWYHSLYDFSLMLEDSPLIGCTAFAASGEATLNSHLIIGRNWDFEGGGIFEKDKVLAIFKPEGKIPFASITWPGHIGVVTGINKEKIFVSINGARGGKIMDNGIPSLLLIRNLLETSKSIDDVIDTVTHTAVMIPFILMVGDGKNGEAVVIELTPQNYGIRKMERGMLPLTNHFLTPSLSEDKLNLKVKYKTSTQFRYERLKELLEKSWGKITPEIGVAILRDRKGKGDLMLPLGNRIAIDPLISTHSIVVDATELKIWISEYPHNLGKYIMFDLKELFESNEPPKSNIQYIEEDKLLYSEEYKRYIEAMELLKDARLLIRSGRYNEALTNLKLGLTLDEDNEEIVIELAKLYDKLGDRKESIKYWKRYLTLYPHTPYLRDEAKRILSNYEASNN